MTGRLLAFHRWLGLVAGLMILIAAFTAIGLNHQDWLRRPAGTGGPQGPYAKFISAMATDPREPRHMLVGTNDGLFRSHDGGAHWEEAVLPVPAEQVSALVYDPGHPGVVYAAFRAIGVYRSDDGGAIWEEVLLPFMPPEGTQIAGLSLGLGGDLVLATTAGVYRSHAGQWHLTPRPAALPEVGKRWVQLVYDLHDGQFWGRYGAPVTDAVSWSLIALVCSGYILFVWRALRTRAARRRVRAIRVLPVREEALR